MSELNIGVDGFTVPIDAAVARFVTLGKSGAGKTNGDAVLIEEFVRVCVPTIVMDPLGTMWGLRSSADGNGPGLSIAIFGGTHGDLPLPAHRGEYLADFVSEGISAVFDMSLLAPEEHLEFAKEFLPRLLQRAKVNMHVNLQEADRFAPQRAVSSPVTMFARASRNAGIGWSFSKQKPQVLHKEVIDSANAFFAMKMTGELAQEAVGGEIGSRIGKKAAARMMTELPSFKRGEAWFVPDADWLGADADEWDTQRMRFRLRDTFEVKPPKVGEARREQITLATIDLDKLRDALADTINVDAATPADDSVVEPLRARIKALEDEVAMYKQKLARAVDFVCSSAERIARDQLNAVLTIRSQIPVPAEWDGPSAAAKTAEIAPVAPAQGAVVHDRSTTVQDQPAARKAPPTPKARVAPALPRSQSSGEMSAGAARVLAAAIGRHPLRITVTNLALFSGWKKSSGPFRSAFKELRESGHLRIGDEGQVILVRPPAASNKVSPEQRLEAIRSALKPGELLYFDLLMDESPNGLSIDEIELVTYHSRKSGPFRSALKSLRENDLVTLLEHEEESLKVYRINKDLLG